MRGQQDKASGKVKEIGGKLTGDKQLQAEGKTQRVGGTVKKAAQDVKDTAKGAVRGARKSR